MYCRSAGIFVGCRPCGVVCLFVEIFGCENLAQVHGLLSDYHHRNALKYNFIIYCHLCWYAQKDARRLNKDGTPN